MDFYWWNNDRHFLFHVKCTFYIIFALNGTKMNMKNLKLNVCMFQQDNNLKLSSKSTKKGLQERKMKGFETAFTDPIMTINSNKSFW